MNNENDNHPDEKNSLTNEFDDSATPDDIDDSKVKFLNGGKRDDAHVVVEVGSDVSFTGLGKDELMQYANDPFWVRIRMILFIVFWVGWVAMLVAAIVIIVLAPRCPERPDLKWYQTDIVYQINPKSFKDSSEAGSSGAGTGDLEGIKDKIGYLEGLGVNAFWINSLYKSGDLYDGNDVVDHKAIDDMFGSMATFDELRKTTKKKGMKIVLDYIPNHTGKDHEWFQKSKAGDEVFADFYIWANGSETVPPNAWETENGERAWTYDTGRKQWYYHSYLPEYPDLNLRNEKVLAELDSILRFWLDKGVDGFAIQGLQRLVEKNTTGGVVDTTADTVDQMENFELVKRWKAIIDGYSDKPGRERALFAHVKQSGNNTQDYYSAGIHVIMTDALVNVDLDTCDSACIKKRIEDAEPSTYWRGWMVDNDESPRFGSTVEDKLQKAFQTFHLLLRGSAIVYYGDEIAMTDGVVDAKDQKDPLNRLGKSRDPYRTPMLWNNEENAGFCAKNVTPWLPVNENYKSKSVQYNSAQLVGYTTLKSFEDLAELRQKESFQWGAVEVKLLNSDIMYFTRKAEGFPGYLVAINRGGKSAYSFASIADEVELVYDSMGTDRVGTKFTTKDESIGFLAPGEVYVFKY